MILVRVNLKEIYQNISYNNKEVNLAVTQWKTKRIRFCDRNGKTHWFCDKIPSVRGKQNALILR